MRASPGGGRDPAGALLGEGPRWDARRPGCSGSTSRRASCTSSTRARRRSRDRARHPGRRRGADRVGRCARRAGRPPGAGRSRRRVRARRWCEIPHGRRRCGSNDGACDAAGRFWVGSMALDYAPGRGARSTATRASTASSACSTEVDAFERDRLVAGRQRRCTTSTRSRTGSIVFDFDVATGTISERRPFVSIERGDGIPDGLAVDDEGGVWVALSAAALRPPLRRGRRRSTRVARRARGECHRVLLRRRRRPLALRDDAASCPRAERQPLAGSVFVAESTCSGPPARPFSRRAWERRTAPSDAEPTSAR